MRQPEQGQQAVVLYRHAPAVGVGHPDVGILLIVRLAEGQLDQRLVALGQSYGGVRFGCGRGVARGDLHNARQLHPLDELQDNRLVGPGVDRFFHPPCAVGVALQLNRAALAPESQRVKVEILRYEPQVAPIIGVARHPVGEVAVDEDRVLCAGQSHVGLPPEQRRGTHFK